MSELQCTADVLMIRPANFGANQQTAESNRFQGASEFPVNAQAAATLEFDALVDNLRDAKVNVHLFEDTLEPQTPDAIFPNNWVSFHADGAAVLYPMLAPNRRFERRMDILESLSRSSGFQLRRIVDLTHREGEAQFLEGTGSLVLDRVNRIAYACLSSRTHLDALGEYAQLLDYEVVAFDAADSNGHPIYHTNVMLSVGARFAAICADSIREHQRAAVLDALKSTRHRVIELSHAQMNAFGGNMLELATTDRSSIVALSERARSALTNHQLDELESWAGRIISTPIPTIETVGGGSVRCMLAEIHLPRASS